jgi:hypothetical protein
MYDMHAVEYKLMAGTFDSNTNNWEDNMIYTLPS